MHSNVLRIKNRIMLEKIEKIQELLNVPNVDAEPETAITNMKILNLLVSLRADAEQLNLCGVSQQRELLFAYEKMRTSQIIGATDEWRYANVDLFLSKL